MQISLYRQKYQLCRKQRVCRNKERVMKEYLTKVKKIWQLELRSFNKVITSNTFTMPVLTTTVGIIDWTIKEIK